MQDWTGQWHQRLQVPSICPLWVISGALGSAAGYPRCSAADGSREAHLPDLTLSWVSDDPGVYFLLSEARPGCHAAFWLGAAAITLIFGFLGFLASRLPLCSPLAMSISPWSVLLSGLTAFRRCLPNALSHRSSSDGARRSARVSIRPLYGAVAAFTVG